jgi:hypothetical protein
VEDVLVAVPDDVELVAVAHLLDHDVAAGIADLVLDGDVAAPVLQGVFEDVRQVADHLVRLVGFW